MRVSRFAEHLQDLAVPGRVADTVADDLHEVADDRSRGGHMRHEAPFAVGPNSLPCGAAARTSNFAGLSANADRASEGAVRIAEDVVAPRFQRDRPTRLALECDAGLAVDAQALQMEVVRGALVAHGDRVAP